MINNIVNTFRKQAKEHRLIKSFYYNRNYEIGAGKDKYPLFWLEDPVLGKNQNNVFSNSVNFSILFIPNEEKTVLELQSLAFSTGLNIIERLRQDEDPAINIQPDWTYFTLRNYYDDDACGCRFSVNFTQVNMQNLCLIEEQFDTEKEIELRVEAGLPSFQVYANKLPDFSIRTSKQSI